MKNIVQFDNKWYQFVRFVIVGIIATIIHYGIYWLLINVINVSLAYTIGYLVSFVCNFFLTSYFTFKSEATIKKGFGFGFAHCVNYLLHIGLLNLFLYFGMEKDLAPIPVFCMVIPVNFLLVRYVFNRK